MFCIILSIIFSIAVSYYIRTKKEQASFGFCIFLLVICTAISIGNYGWECLLLTPILSISGSYAILAIYNEIEEPYEKKDIIISISIFVVTSIISYNTITPKDECLAEFSSYKVSVEFDLVEYNGVGREFEYYAFVNGQNIAKSKIVHSNGTSQIECFAKVVENDSYKYPDVGYNSETINAWDTNVCYIYIIVYEYGGQDNYGSSAEFRVKFKFEGYEKY